MSKHEIIRQLLYEYVRGELDPDTRKRVEGHCSSCSQCSADLDMMKATLAIVPYTTTEPSTDLPEEFWKSFSGNVLARIRQAEVAGMRRRSSFWEAIQPWLALHRPQVAVASGAIAALILGFIGWRVVLLPENEVAKQKIAEHVVVADTASGKISQYFRRSKVLLVGITNMKTPDGRPIDLRVEQEISRKLVREARSLDFDYLDPQATRLIRDLEKIQIELANMNQEVQLPNVEMIRSGIHRENLLFKTRMAESAYESARFVNVNEKH